MRDQIKYRAGYKYQVAETYAVKVAIKAETEIITYFIDLHTDGTLRIKPVTRGMDPVAQHTIQKTPCAGLWFMMLCTSL